MRPASIQPQNESARAVWNAPAGRYDAISRSIAVAIGHAVERLRAVPARARDGVTGAALRAALRRALVTWHESFPSPLGDAQPRAFPITPGRSRPVPRAAAVRL